MASEKRTVPISYEMVKRAMKQKGDARGKRYTLKELACDLGYNYENLWRDMKEGKVAPFMFDCLVTALNAAPESLRGETDKLEPYGYSELLKEGRNRIGIVSYMLDKLNIDYLSAKKFSPDEKLEMYGVMYKALENKALDIVRQHIEKEGHHGND